MKRSRLMGILWAGLSLVLEALPAHSQRFQWQSLNNCTPASAAWILGFFGYQSDQEKLRLILRPDPQDVTVTLSEVAQVFQDQGMKTWERFGTDPKSLRSLAGEKIPVLIKIWLNDPPYRLAHTLVVSGIDAQGKYVLQDPLRGPDRHLDAAELEETWNILGRPLLAAIPLADPRAELISKVLGPDSSPAKSSAIYEAQPMETSQSALVRTYPGIPWSNLAVALGNQGKNSQAAVIWEKAWRSGLPWRWLWYHEQALSLWYTQGMRETLTKTLDDLEQRAPNLAMVRRWRQELLPQKPQVFISDVHTASLYFFALNQGPAPRDLLNIDAHSDLWPVPRQETLGWKVPALVQAQLGQWRRDQVPQCYSWILPLMDGPVGQVSWVSPGGKTIESEITDSEIFPAYMNRYSYVHMFSLDTWLAHGEVPPWVSIDLDSFRDSGGQDQSGLLRRSFEKVLKSPDLRVLTVAVSRNYQNSESQALELLRQAMDVILAHPTDKITMDFTLFEEERSRWAQERRLREDSLPRLNPSQIRAALGPRTEDPRIQIIR